MRNNMVSKGNRHNSDFQIAYFIAGSCFTPDGAYSLLLDLYEERQRSVENLEVSKLRSQASFLKLTEALNNPTASDADKLIAQADLLEFNISEKNFAPLVIAAQNELAFIKKCLDVVQPLRKYAHLPKDDATQAMQREEWKYELMHRAENYLLTIGHIPTDHFATMRMHPDFDAEISQTIFNLQHRMRTDPKFQLPTRESSFNLPLLLGLDEIIEDKQIEYQQPNDQHDS